MFCFLVKKSLLPDTAGAQPTDAAQATGHNAMLANEVYVLKANLRLLADDILEGFPDSAILRIDIVLFCFFPYIEWLPLS